MKKTKSGNVDPSLGTDDTLGRDTKLIRPGKRAPIFLPEETQEKREIPMMEALHANGVLVSDDFREENPCLLSGIQLSTGNPRRQGRGSLPFGRTPPLDLPELINALEKDKVHEPVYETGGGGTACLGRF